MTELIAIASAALGLTLSEPVPLVGSDRSSVLRCRTPANGTVVVKCYPASAPGPESFAAECAGLRFIAGTGAGPELAVEAPSDLAGDLLQVASLLAPGQFDVFSPGDICPDNNLITATDVKFIDFENAEFHSVFLDAAYLRMPFSTSGAYSGCLTSSPNRRRLVTATCSAAAFPSWRPMRYGSRESAGPWRRGRCTR